MEHVSIMKIIVEQIKHDTISQRVNATLFKSVYNHYKGANEHTVNMKT